MRAVNIAYVVLFVSVTNGFLNWEDALKLSSLKKWISLFFRYLNPFLWHTYVVGTPPLSVELIFMFPPLKILKLSHFLYVVYFIVQNSTLLKTLFANFFFDLKKFFIVSNSCYFYLAFKQLPPYSPSIFISLRQF